MNIAPNRIAVYLTAAASLLAALAPAVANLDLTSTVGVVGGLAGLVAVVRKWLTGWIAHEHSVHGIDGPIPLDVPADVPPGESSS